MHSLKVKEVELVTNAYLKRRFFFETGGELKDWGGLSDGQVREGPAANVANPALSEPSKLSISS